MPNILRTKYLPILLATFAAGILASSTWAASKKPEKAKPYPLATCVVSGEKLGGAMGEPHVFAYQGREIKLCCKDCLKDFKDCLKDFNKEPAKYIAKVDAAAKAVKAYPLNVCLVSDEKLGGDMGEPYEFIYEGREIKLCCKSCLKDFQKDSAKFVKKFDDALKSPKAAVKPEVPGDEHGPHKH